MFAALALDHTDGRSDAPMAVDMIDRSDSANVAQPRLREALERIRPQLDALADQQLLPINLDPISAVTIARGALPGLLALRSQLASMINSFALSNLDDLETYALALLQAQTVYQGICAHSGLLTDLSTEANELRARLLADVTVLSQRGHISPTRMHGLKGPKGHRNIASDLLTLTGLLRDCWPDIANKTATREDELDRAEILGDQLISAIGTREQQTEMATSAALQRQRAYTLFVRAYDEIRRAVSYLRWHAGDVNRIAPSLYAKRKRTSRRRERTDASPNDPTDPDATSGSDLPAPDPFLH